MQMPIDDDDTFYIIIIIKKLEINANVAIKVFLFHWAIEIDKWLEQEKGLTYHLWNLG